MKSFSINEFSTIARKSIFIKPKNLETIKDNPEKAGKLIVCRDNKIAVGLANYVNLLAFSSEKLLKMFQYRENFLARSGKH